MMRISGSASRRLTSACSPVESMNVTPLRSRASQDDKKTSATIDAPT